MRTFTKHMVYSVNGEGHIERRHGELPSVVKLPALSVTVEPNASPQRTAKLLRGLADEIEAEL